MTPVAPSTLEPCPAEHELYAAADAANPDAALGGHLRKCDKCRTTVESILADNALANELAGAVQKREHNARAGGGAPAAGSSGVMHAAELQPDTTIADFTIRTVLGVGGMGVVYLAVQQAPRRNVALKVLRADLATPELLRRFEHESAALALLKHPAIAQVFQAGTVNVSGAPRAYMAMELVKGTRLDEFCKERDLSRAARLTLIADVADGVEHAHRRGVIHRDLKPANILVEAGDAPGARPLPRILDFGVAKFSQDSGVEGQRIEQTVQGSFLGTFAFAAPEQVSGDPNAIDARADVYALGVMLYELIVGRRPRDMGSSLADAIRAVGSGKIIAPESVGVKLDAELHTVIMTALAAEPERRYATAAALAEDIRRYLDKRPLRARPDSTLYTLRKAIARHPYRACAAGAFALLAVGAVAITIIMQMRVIDAERLKTEAEASKSATKIGVFGPLELTNEDESDSPAITTIDQFIVLAADKIDKTLQHAPVERADLLSQLGRAALSRNSRPEGASMLERVAAIRRTQAEAQPLPLADALVDLGLARYRLNQFEKARDHFAEALAIREKYLLPRDPKINDARYWLGVSYHGWKKYDQAEPLLRQAAEDQQRARPDSEEVAEYLNGVSACIRARGDFAGALELARAAQRHIERTEGSNRKHIAFTLSNVIANLLSLNKLDEAEPLLAKALEHRIEWYGDDSPRLAPTLVQIAGLHMRQGGWGESAEQREHLTSAQSSAHRALDLCRRVYPGDHESVAEALSLLGQIRMRRGDNQACDLLNEAFAMRGRLPQSSSGDLGHSQSLLGECLRRFSPANAMPPSAEQHLRQGLERVRSAYGPTNRRTLDAITRLRDWCVAANRADEAAGLTRELDAAAAQARP
ncbi:MAG: serine/threonine-protein kinase [Phycisphaerales bacterium]|nr:serine/threonine-protein kinase [Phycisphaerales bacterium]